MSVYRLALRSQMALIPKRSIFQGLPELRPIGRRAMATSSQKKQEFLCILPDKPNALNLRKQVRPTHLEDIKPLVASGRVVVGGAMVEKHPAAGEGVPFKGSMMIYTGETIEDVRAVLLNDIYATSGVWDLEKVQIIPFISAIRQPLS
ncbi:hypothetical protein FE257_011576 [Aspergillus nanangensis]|uniref:YCII-related domain-containing protein n=1 Tax=Aspergillus nanangensis TaxID=2582783 RepID=A0AAD4GRA3_ASPNN|nr:hypothetical protein FE257_011576 [Aspergillus nanangensis]